MVEIVDATWDYLLFKTVIEKSFKEDLEPSLKKNGYTFEPMCKSDDYSMRISRKNDSKHAADINYFNGVGGNWNFVATVLDDDLMGTIVKYAEQWENIGKNSEPKLPMRSTINKAYITDA